MTQIRASPNIKWDFVSLNEKKEYMIIYTQHKESNYFFGNETLVELVKFLEKPRTIPDIVKKINHRINPNAITNYLNSMWHQKLIVDANYKINNAYASYWADNGIVPIDAQNKIEQYSFNIINHSGNTNAQNAIKNSIKKMGGNIKQKNNNTKKSIVIVIVNDYLQPELKKLNVKFRKQQQIWMPIILIGNTPMMGPMFNAEKQIDFNTPCYKCLYKRMKELRQVRNTIGKIIKNGELYHSNFIENDAVNSVAYQFTLQMIRYLVMGGDLNKKIYRINWMNGKTDKHIVCRLPQCSVCGVPLENDRELKPFEFEKIKKSVKTSAGHKNITPKETLDKYMYLVSDVNGVVEYIKRTSEKNDTWNHVYQSGNNIALQSDNIFIAISSLKMHNAGKGQSEEQAKASALCESIERYSTAFQGDEIRIKKKYNEFKNKNAMKPNKFLNYSQQQYKTREEKNFFANPFIFVPKPFNENEEYEWSPIWSIIEEKKVWVPTQLLYFGYPYNNNCIAVPDTNGVAAGNSKTEAFVQAFLECIERDNIAIWWFNKLKYPEVELKNFNQYSNKATEIYQKKYNKKLYAIDISNDLTIPTFVVISHNRTENNQEICFTAASHFDPDIAMTRAICEQNQIINLIQNNKNNNILSPEFEKWIKNANINDKKLTYIKPNNQKKKKRQNYKNCNLNINEQKNKCINICKEKKWEIYVADFTRIDIKMPVVRVMIPQLRSMHTRLAKGRLYDIPVKLGMIKKPLKENELNKTNIFI